MKKLTDIERQMVEDNHNLIYWYANKKNLDLDEWYDLLAIELCKTVRKYNQDRGSLSTYFKLRADIMVYRKLQEKYRSGELYDYEIDESQHCDEAVEVFDKVDSDIALESLLDSLETDRDRLIIKMKLDGYTQKEIAEETGLTQQGVGWVLRRVRERLDADR